MMPLSGNQQVKRLARSVNGKTVAAPAMNRIYLMHFDKTKVRNTEEAVAKLAKLADVEYAEPNRIVYALGNTESQAGQSKALMDVQDQANGGGKNISYDDPLFGQQWGLQTMKLPQLWQQPIITQKRPIIAILDTGVDIDHPNLYFDEMRTFSKDKNAAFDFCEAEYFMAFRDGKMVGRVAAIISHSANKK